MLLPNIKLFWKTKSGLELVFLPHFLHNFYRKIFISGYSINWPHAILWLPLIPEISNNVCMVILCYPGCDVINFEVNLIFLIKPFFYISKKLRQKFRYLENEKSFSDETKSIFHHFWRDTTEANKNCFFLEGESPTLRKGVLKICSKFTGGHPCRNYISAWVFPCKFAAYFQITFS